MFSMRSVLVLLTAAFALTAPVTADDDDKSPAKERAEERKNRAAERKAMREAEKQAKADLKEAKKKGDKDAIAKAEAALKEIEDAKKGEALDSPKLDKEFDGLQKAQALLAEVNDEASAAKAAKKICSIFGVIAPPIDMSMSELEKWAAEQNKVSAQMERLRKMPYFESSGLQEAWTNVTDPFSRKRAQRMKK